LLRSRPEHTLTFYASTILGDCLIPSGDENFHLFSLVVEYVSVPPEDDAFGVFHYVAYSNIEFDFHFGSPMRYEALVVEAFMLQ